MKMELKDTKSANVSHGKQKPSPGFTVLPPSILEQFHMVMWKSWLSSNDSQSQTDEVQHKNSAHHKLLQCYMVGKDDATQVYLECLTAFSSKLRLFGFQFRNLMT